MVSMTNGNASVLLKNARLIDPTGNREGNGAVLIRDGMIADIAWGASPTPSEGTQVIDCAGHVLCPGLIDMRAFVGEPGAEHRETLKSASEAGAAGGVTTIVCMPQTNPVIDDPAIVDFVLHRARDTAVVNIRPAAALTKGLGGRAMTYAKDFDALIMHHVEDADLVGEGVMNEGELAGRLGLPGIQREAEPL